MRFFWMVVVAGLAGCSAKSKVEEQANVPATDGAVPALSNSAGETAAGKSLAEVDSVSITPSVPKRGESLIAKVSDPHARILYFTWLLNGEEVAGQHDDRLPGDLVVKGAKIAVRVTPKVDGNDGASKTSLEIVVGNTAPRIAAFDLVSSTDGKVVLQTRTEDLDGDPLTFRLVSGPPGMTLSPTGEISWVAPAEFSKEITFSVGATDGEQEFVFDGAVGSK